MKPTSKCYTNIISIPPEVLAEFEAEGEQIANDFTSALEQIPVDKSKGNSSKT